MATPLIKPVVRKVIGAGYVVRLAPEGLYLRELYRRLEIGPISYGAIYLQGVRANVDAQKKQKRKKVSRGLLSIGR